MPLEIFFNVLICCDERSEVMRRCLSLVPFLKYKLGKQAFERRDCVALSANIFKNEIQITREHQLTAQLLTRNH